jgi:hypothetical protein
LITASIEAERQFEAARQAKRVFYETPKLAGSLPSLDEIQQNANLQLDYIKQASNAKEIISQGFAAHSFLPTRKDRSY